MDTHTYQICVKGHLDERWFEWFTGLSLAHTAAGETVITGVVLDQAALHAVLSRIRDLGLELIAVQQIAAQQVGELL